MYQLYSVMSTVKWQDAKSEVPGTPRKTREAI